MVNDVRARKSLAEAVGASGPIQNERQFWNTVLTALAGTETRAATLSEFIYKLGELLGGGDVAIVRDGDVIDGTGGEFTVTVANGEITGGTWDAD